MKESRTKNSIKNVCFAFTSYFITLLPQFINRTVFIYFLSSKYLGLDSLFSNVLGFLSLTELGIGGALNYSLYEPIDNDDVETIKSIMNLYRKVYRLIGGIVLVLGTLLTPFLPFLIRDMPQNIPHIYLYYLLYVLKAGISYFYTYKRALIICNQKEYISTLTISVSRIAICVMQLLILVWLQSFVAYIVVEILVVLCENIVISILADHLYPYLHESASKLLPEVSHAIKKNVCAMMFHKVANVIVSTSDNLIISKFVGLITVGMYSNYLLVVSSLNRLINRVLKAIIASVGNLMLSNNKNHVETTLNRFLFLNFWTCGFCSIALFCLLQSFISLWIGEKYLLSDFVLLSIVLDFYIRGLRLAISVFKDASGIFWYDRFSPLLGSILNIILSIPLAIRYGVSGVLAGTIISTLLIPFWYEAYALYKYYFHKSFKEYIFRQVLYAVTTLAVGAGCYFLCQCVLFRGVLGFVLKVVICVLVPNVTFTILFFHTDEFIFFLNFAKRIMGQGRKQKYCKKVNKET